VGLHPTDKWITLITHPANESLVIGMAREGKMAVRVAFHNHELLRHVVLTDTPGSGDPQLLSEMVRDFLPVCDLLLYFINPTSPLDEAELPLLNLKHEH